MASLWFVTKDEMVFGPLLSEEVEEKLRSSDIAPDDLIWGRGMSSWQSLRWWQQELPNLQDNTVVAELTGINEAWHYALGGQSFGPFNRVDLIGELKNVLDISQVMLWTKGMKEWAQVFEFHDILTEVGVNKRIFPRAELHGKGVIKADGNTLVAELLTISEGGLGVHLQSGLVPGQTVTVEIQSPQFRAHFAARAEVRYCSNGVVGLRFTNLNSEGKGAITTFVRQNQTRFVLKAA